MIWFVVIASLAALSVSVTIIAVACDIKKEQREREQEFNIEYQKLCETFR